MPPHALPPRGADAGGGGAPAHPPARELQLAWGGQVSPVQALRERVAALARRDAARSSSWAMLGQVAAILASTANFLLLARLVGPAEYGVIAGTWALVLAVSPLASFGAERLLVRDISGRGQTPGDALGSALVTCLIGWTLAVGALVGLHSVLLPQTPLALLVNLAVADIVSMGVVTLITGLLFATGNARAAGISSVIVNLTKLLAVVTFAVVGDADPVTWATIYATFAVVSATGQLLWAFSRVGAPRAVDYHFFTRAREGLPFSGNVIASIVQNDADKTLLVRYGLAAEAGVYSVAYRLVGMAVLPLSAVMQAMFPRFFAAGAAGGLPGTVAFGRRLLPPLLGYGLVAAVGLLAVTPLVPLVVGEEYRASMPLLALLAPLVLFKAGQTVVGDMLTGAGRQGTRTGCVAVAAGVNVALNLVLIPLLGVTGAVIATYVAEVLQITLVVLAVRRWLARGATQS